MDEATARIPLRNRKGEIVAYALVDAVDEPALTALGRWCRGNDGYATKGRRWPDGRKRRNLRLHRLLLGLEDDDPRQGDHINHDRLDNRRANLRIVTRKENLQNTSSHRDGSSRFRGVSWHKSRGQWRAAATKDGRHVHIGRFASEQEAADAARAWRLANFTGAVE